jgi:NAD-dependent DNA ligase
MAGEGDVEGEPDSTEIAALAQSLAYHSDLYYNHAAPEISDTEFDALLDQLKALDPDNPQLSKVGHDPDPGSVKVEHMFPMRSLDKATEDEELTHFVHTTTMGAMRFVSQPKLDGSALSLEYARGDWCVPPPAEMANVARTSPVTLAESPIFPNHSPLKSMHTSAARW